jgi:molybdate/tungstate transport system permease protein
MTALFAAAASLLLLFVVLPLVSLVFGSGPGALVDAFADAEVRSSVVLTFTAAAWATLLAFVTGVPLAYLLARHEFPGKGWVEGLVRLPIVVPHTAAGIALLTVFSRNAAAGRALGAVGLDFTDAVAGIVVGMLFVSLPFLVVGAQAAFEAVDPEIEAMAEVEGATQWQVFTRVTLPLAWRGVASGAVMMWGRGISEFGAVVILAYHPKIVPVLVYERFSGFGLDAARPVALVLIVVSLAVFVALRALVAHRRVGRSGRLVGR